MLTEKQLKEISDTADRHLAHGAQPSPTDPQQRLFHGLMVILDFECVKYGDAPEGVTDKDIKAYLMKHKREIRSEAISSYMGVFAGVFDFLKDEK